ncbi:MICAL-like protein [Aphomia sociella]
MSERKGTKALELWCKRLVKDCPNVQIDNMTTSWKNGIAFCALVHHFRPDLIDISTLDPENIYENNQLAFTLAEKHLGIPSLLDPEDMVKSEVPDRLSILTYLSQFYQRLGHTVNTKSNDSDTKISTPSTTQAAAPINFTKTAHEKCAACGLPVYLAQRLLVSHKLYHRRCFRCSKCSGHLSPKNFELIEGSEFTCDSCKNEKTLSKFLNNNDHNQMGMLAFNDTLPELSSEVKKEEPITPKQRLRPQSILEKISMFEKNSEKETTYIEDKITNLSLKDNVNSNIKELSTSSIKSTTGTHEDNVKSVYPNIDLESTVDSKHLNQETEELLHKNKPEKVYKTNINKFNFLQTQLSSDMLDDIDKALDIVELEETRHNKEDCSSDVTENVISNVNQINDEPNCIHKEESNVTDDIRIANSHSTSSNTEHSPTIISDVVKTDDEITISVPPRRKKQQHTPEKLKAACEIDNTGTPSQAKDYPKHLNPFSDDEDECEIPSKEPPKKISTNPFGSTDEEDDDVPPIQSTPKPLDGHTTTPMKRLIAVNPFWSDGEEPSSDEDETHDNSSKMYKSSIATSTPNLPSSVPRRKKAKAPPPPVITVVEHPSTSMDDVASISSLSSYNSTIHSDQKSVGHSTPLMKKKRLAPTPDSLSTMSGYDGSMEISVDTSGIRNTSDGGRKIKGPAPGLPLPERREVKLQISPEELQVQLDLLETQQLGLERQGVLIEQMIRDKCEGDDSTSVPQEEVEDLVIQLCELVNEKNDLFRKQTELMYIRRQQRLEQEQADIEHEIRIIQSRPAVNRIDADKAREEQLVSRLVEIVRMRDELVQQIDSERRRERQEDLAIATSIASKRAQRNSESNSSSIKSAEVVTTPKKNKVKDKVKKQLKKAKHTLISKKKEDSGERKEEKAEKEKKSK